MIIEKYHRNRAYTIKLREIENSLPEGFISKLYDHPGPVSAYISPKDQARNKLLAATSKEEFF